MLGAGDVWRLDRIQLDEIPENHHEQPGDSDGQDGLYVPMKYINYL